MTYSQLTDRATGFVPVPRTLYDALLTGELSKRELLATLLVLRLTYGCRGNRWARMRQADLAVVGIAANHAKACLESLQRQGLLEKNASGVRYRVVMPAAPVHVPVKTAVRMQRLETLVARQLIEPSPNGNFSARHLPKRGSQLFPKREEATSRNGNTPKVVLWSFSRSEGGFVKKVDGAIDSDIHK